MPAGRLIKLNIDDTVLVGLRSVSRSTELDLAEATTAESTNQWKEYEAMYKGQTMSAEGLVISGSSNTTPEDLYDLIAAATKVTAYYGGTETGDTYYEADALINSLEEENSYDDLQSYSVEIQITGEPTKGTVS